MESLHPVYSPPTEEFPRTFNVKTASVYLQLLLKHHTCPVMVIRPSIHSLTNSVVHSLVASFIHLLTCSCVFNYFYFFHFFFLGDRLVVDTNSTLFNQSAVLVSPPYNRSRDWHSKCLRFRYMLRGPGEKTMSIYQKTSSYREIPIWVSKMNTGQNWIYGQVPLSSVSEFQVYVVMCGDTVKFHGWPSPTPLFLSLPTLTPVHCPSRYIVLGWTILLHMILYIPGWRGTM